MTETTTPSQKDVDILRTLASQIHEIAQLPVQKEKAELWRRMNDRDPVRPMVWINEEPWQEMNVDDELTPRCEDQRCRGIEGGFLSTLYHWKHMPADMIVEDRVCSGIACSSTGIGISQKGEWLKQEGGGIYSQHFEPQICGPEDVEKIRMPTLSVDREATERSFEFLNGIFKDVIPVEKVGTQHMWFTPWDNLIRLVSIENIMVDMVERPEFVNAMVSRFVDAEMHVLDQMEELGLFSLGLGAVRVGSGGFAYTSDLPPADYTPGRVRPLDNWGCGNAQIFSEVSPEMHWEFSLKHEMRWLERWGLTYYGCCEQLHHKMDILRRIPNLRKISLSPWADIPTALENGAGEYVLSIKPSPAILAEDNWHPDRARADIRARLDEAEGCAVELILKDISTVRNKPQRLWEWSRIAMEEAEA